MFKRGMDSQGQLSVEYLLLLVVIFVVFGFMITKLIIPSIDAGNDISKVSDASNLVNTYANAANIVYSNGPGAKRTFNVYVPSNMTIVIGGSQINGTVKLSNGSNKTVIANTNYPMGPHTFNPTKGNHVAFVTWGADNKTYISNWINT